MKFNTACLCFVVLLVSCQGNTSKARAFITERSEAKNGKLLLKYQFYAGGSLVKDSVTINNISLQGDSIDVVFEAGNAAANTLQLPSHSR